jgi:hypothetical protein
VCGQSRAGRPSIDFLPAATNREYMRRPHRSVQRPTGSRRRHAAHDQSKVAASRAQSLPEALFDEFDGWLSDQPSLIDMSAIFDPMIDWTASRRGDAWLVALQLLVHAASDPPIAVVFQKRYAQFRRKLAKLLES